MVGGRDVHGGKWFREETVSHAGVHHQLKRLGAPEGRSIIAPAAARSLRGARAGLPCLRLLVRVSNHSQSPDAVQGSRRDVRNQDLKLGEWRNISFQAFYWRFE